MTSSSLHGPPQHIVSRRAATAAAIVTRASIMRPASVASTMPGYRPWIESYLNWYAMYSFAAPELMSLRSIASDLAMMRATRRPMRPKPLMPPATAMVGAPAVARIGVAERELTEDVNAEAPVARRRSFMIVVAVVLCWIDEALR